jgi:hypothetical protein
MRKKFKQVDTSGDGALDFTEVSVLIREVCHASIRARSRLCTLAHVQLCVSSVPSRARSLSSLACSLSLTRAISRALSRSLSRALAPSHLYPFRCR